MVTLTLGLSCITVTRLVQNQCQDDGATSRHVHALIHVGRVWARWSLSSSRACGDRVHRLEVSSLTIDTRRLADIAETIVSPISHRISYLFDALD